MIQLLWLTIKRKVKVIIYTRFRKFKVKFTYLNNHKLFFNLHFFFLKTYWQIKNKVVLWGIILDYTVSII